PMVYLMTEADTDPSLWTLAWDAAGIPYRELPSAALFERLPTLAISQARAAFELPDRAMRTDLLLARMAEAALGAGAEIRSGTTAARLIARGDFVTAIETEQGEVLEAGLVILAGNTKGPTLLAE